MQMPIMQTAVYARSYFLQRSGFPLHQLCKVLWSKLCLDPHAPGGELRDVLGNVVRQCANSLLGSYVHQELI